MSERRKPRYARSCVLFAAVVAACAPCAVGIARAEVLTYRLSASTPGLEVWTTPATERVFRDTPVPAAEDTEIRVDAARNEFEPFVVVARPSAAGTVPVSIGSFGAGIEVELAQVKYVTVTTASDNLGRTGENPDPLLPLALPASIALPAGQNTALWFTVHVPRAAPPGDYSATVQVGSVAVPVRLHVFDFAIPDEVHVLSEMTVDYGAIMSAYSVGLGDYFSYVERINQFMIDHRLTPSTPVWPGALTYGGGAPALSYDCAGHLVDNDGAWGFEVPAAKYLGGAGFNNGTGFPSFRAALAGNIPAADERPSAFCGQFRSAADWVAGNNPDSPYNVEWREYVTALRDYLDGLHYLAKSYWRIGNEPFSTADFDAIAWYAQLLKSAAPDLMLQVAKEPRPEIFAHPAFTAAKIDSWLAPSNRFDPQVSGERDALYGESTWLYFLGSARTPRFNPITLDHPGVEARLTGWYLWKHRVRGIAHDSMNTWSPNPWTTPWDGSHNGGLALLYPPSELDAPIPYGSNGHRFVSSIRLELLREGFEDYEYLRALAGGLPQVGIASPADALVDRMVNGVTAYSRDGASFAVLRRQIGQYLGGERSTFPDAAPPAAHPRAEGPPADYFINFQDPAGPPFDDPLVVDGRTYTKIGWPPYSAALGYGWYGDFTQARTFYDPAAPNPLAASGVYDDFGRIKTFEFDLPNGTYDVTVSVGRVGRSFPRNKVVIEGVPFIADEPSSGFLVRSGAVTVVDHTLSLELGVDLEYTMLNSLDVIARDHDGDGIPDGYERQYSCLSELFADAAFDHDQDGLTSLDEYVRGTNPCLDDTDGGGDNDGSEVANLRNPLAWGDDLALTLMVHRADTAVALDWAAVHGANASIDGPYWVYRADGDPTGPFSLLTNPLPDGVEGVDDPDPACNPCFYLLFNARRD